MTFYRIFYLDFFSDFLINLDTIVPDAAIAKNSTRRTTNTPIYLITRVPIIHVQLSLTMIMVAPALSSFEIVMECHASLPSSSI